MNPSDPQFLYLALVLPGIFGLTLTVHGISKIIQKDSGGYLMLFFGILFFLMVFGGYLFFSTYLVSSQ